MAGIDKRTGKIDVAIISEFITQNTAGKELVGIRNG
jgi:hypothetical protein